MKSERHPASTDTEQRRHLTRRLSRADELMAAGDMEGRAVWHRIEEAIDELGRTEPRMDERQH